MSHIDAGQLQRGEYVGPIQFRDGSYYLGHSWSMTKSPAVFFAARVTRPNFGGNAKNPGNAYNVYIVAVQHLLALVGAKLVAIWQLLSRTMRLVEKTKRLSTLRPSDLTS